MSIIWNHYVVSDLNMMSHNNSSSRGRWRQKDEKEFEAILTWNPFSADQKEKDFYK